MLNTSIAFSVLVENERVFLWAGSYMLEYLSVNVFNIARFLRTQVLAPSVVDLPQCWLVLLTARSGLDIFRCLRRALSS